MLSLDVLAKLIENSLLKVGKPPFDEFHSLQTNKTSITRESFSLRTLPSPGLVMLLSAAIYTSQCTEFQDSYLFRRSCLRKTFRKTTNLVAEVSIRRQLQRQPRPQGLLLVQNGGWRNPWPWLQKFFRILSRKHFEMSSFPLNNGFRLQKQTGPPDAKTNLRKRSKSHFIMCHVTKYSTILGVFQQPWPG